MSYKDGGPAFPVVGQPMPGGNPGDLMGQLHHGMSLRDYFAGHNAAAMLMTTSSDSDLPNLDYRQERDGLTVAQRISKIAYEMADAMLEARKC